MPRASSALVSSASVALAAVLLVGCTTPEPAPSGSASPSASSTPPTTPEPSPTTSTPVSTPVDVPCETLVSLQTMYDYNPNYSLLASWTPDAGTPAAEAVAAKGTICRWQNNSSGETIDISVASFDAATIEAKANATFAESTMVPTYGGDEGYFGIVDGAGEAVVFDGSYWVVVSSARFLEPGDAEPIVTSVLDALP